MVLVKVLLLSASGKLVFASTVDLGLFFHLTGITSQLPTQHAFQKGILWYLSQSWCFIARLNALPSNRAKGRGNPGHFPFIYAAGCREVVVNMSLSFCSQLYTGIWGKWRTRVTTSHQTQLHHRRTNIGWKEEDRNSCTLMSSVWAGLLALCPLRIKLLQVIWKQQA